MNFTIPGSLPTLNEIIDASKSHWAEYHEMKSDYTGLVALACRKISKMKKVDVEITWYCGSRRQDPDNIMAGQKFIFDGLVAAGKLENDGWKQVRNITHRFLIDKKKPRIEVVLTEVSGEG